MGLWAGQFGDVTSAGTSRVACLCNAFKLFHTSIQSSRNQTPVHSTLLAKLHLFTGLVTGWEWFVVSPLTRWCHAPATPGACALWERPDTVRSCKDDQRNRILIKWAVTAACPLHSRFYWTANPVNTNICITFVQCWSNVGDVGPTLYKCYTNVLCLMGSYVSTRRYQRVTLGL